MNKSSKPMRILLGMLLGGALLAGIGTGMAFAEYSDYEYVKQKENIEENPQEHSISYRVEELAADEALVLSEICGGVADEPRFAIGKDLAPYEVRVTATYDEEIFAYELHCYENSISEASRGRSEAGDAFAIGHFLTLDAILMVDDFERIMSAKDVFLDGLKEHKIVDVESSYREYLAEDVLVEVSPDLVSRTDIGQGIGKGLV